MRVLLFLLLSMAMAGAASASSFIVVPAPKGGASMDMVTPPAAAALEAADDIPPQGVDPMVTLSYPFVGDKPPRDVAIVAPPAVLKQISPSVMAMEARPEDRVAVARGNRAHAPFSQPIVFRGGIAGDAFAAPAIPAQPDQPQAASDAKRPVAAGGAKAPDRPEPVAPPSPSPASPIRAPK